MKKYFLMLVAIIFVSSSHLNSENEKRNMALGTGAILVIGYGLYHYFYNPNTNPTTSNELPGQPSPATNDSSTLLDHLHIPSDNQATKELLQELEVAAPEQSTELPHQKEEINAYIPTIDSINSSPTQPTAPYTNPQKTFLKTLNASLKELEAYQKNQGH